MSTHFICKWLRPIYYRRCNRNFKNSISIEEFNSNHLKITFYSSLLHIFWLFFASSFHFAFNLFFSLKRLFLALPSELLSIATSYNKSHTVPVRLTKIGSTELEQSHWIFYRNEKQHQERWRRKIIKMKNRLIEIEYWNRHDSLNLFAARTLFEKQILCSKQQKKTTTKKH